MPVVFVPLETSPGETRVAATPETVQRMVKQGLEVRVQEGAGRAAHFSDQEYREAGAQLVADRSAGLQGCALLLAVGPLAAGDARTVPADCTLVAFVQAPQHPEAAAALRESGASVFAMEAVPRITRAQKMDALSSQANIAGYKAVLLGAAALGKFFPMLMTAAGTVKPAKVVVFGAGVAGLQAIATAKRLGAQVWATDIRAEVQEQVESLGGKFITVEPDEGSAQEAVYASEASEDYKKRQAQAVAQHVAEADVVITTAQVPGRRAPILIPAAMVESMADGAVIVDLAVGQGGNCEVSRPGETVVHQGVSVLGEANLPATVPRHASELYARNVLQVVLHLVPEEKLLLDFEDEITDGAVVLHQGEARHAGLRELLSSAPAATD